MVPDSNLQVCYFLISKLFSYRNYHFFKYLVNTLIVQNLFQGVLKSAGKLTFRTPIAYPKYSGFKQPDPLVF